MLDPGGGPNVVPVWHIRENSMEFHFSTCVESKARELWRCGDVDSIGLSIFPHLLILMESSGS